MTRGIVAGNEEVHVHRSPVSDVSDIDRRTHYLQYRKALFL